MLMYFSAAWTKIVCYGKEQSSFGAVTVSTGIVCHKEEVSVSTLMLRQKNIV